MKKLLIILLCVPLIGLGQGDWLNSENKIFLDEICTTHPLIVELDNSIFGSYGVESFCNCILEKITSKYPSPKVFENKFGIGIKFDMEAFGMDILPFLEECTMMKNIDIENTLDIWPDHIRSAFLMGCNNKKEFLISCMSEKKSELECCKCALDATMIMYPNEDDYLDFMMNADFTTINAFWGTIYQICEKEGIEFEKDELGAFIKIYQTALLGTYEYKSYDELAIDGLGDLEMDVLYEEDIEITRHEEVKPPPEEKPLEANKEIVEEEFSEAFITVEQMPIWGDCSDQACTQTEIMKYISRNFRYPEKAKSIGIEGRIVVVFIIEKDGSVGDIKLLFGIKPDLYLNLSKKEEEEFKKKFNLKKEEVNVFINNAIDEINNEGIRVIKSLPKFTPGKQNGKPVPVKYTVPIKCSLG